MSYLSSGNFLSLQSRVVRAIDRIVDRSGLLRRSLVPADVLRAAQRKLGLDDFGDWRFEQALSVLLHAYEKEAELSAFGRVAVRWDTVRFLSNLLTFRAEELKDPAIARERIDRPIFILGLPRSGTTFLHNLMAQDPANSVARCWQTIFPYPIRRGDPNDVDRRRRIVARQFSAFRRLAPELPSLHPLEADAAQECIEITGQVLQSLRFDTTHYIPSYAEWLDDTGHLEAYRFHKRFLQHLQHQNGARGHWVLKSPDHIFAWDGLNEVYPDARFVMVHRDPLRVLASVARLTEVLREPFTRKIDRLQIGRQVTDRWAEGSRRLIEANKQLHRNPHRIFHVHYSELTRNPVGAVSAIYRHFGLNLTPKVAASLHRSIAERPTGGYGQNGYHFADYGIDPALELQRHRDYVAYFGVEKAPASDLARHTAGARMRMTG